MVAAAAVGPPCTPIAVTVPRDIDGSHSDSQFSYVYDKPSYVYDKRRLELAADGAGAVFTDWSLTVPPAGR